MTAILFQAPVYYEGQWFIFYDFFGTRPAAIALPHGAAPICYGESKHIAA